ncbi:MAG: S8 family serine peptidase [Myxococcales bacterium]|nr:S8 family serine peptidase [Myxococcales bacterium]
MNRYAILGAYFAVVGVLLANLGCGGCPSSNPPPQPLAPSPTPGAKADIEPSKPDVEPSKPVGGSGPGNVGSQKSHSAMLEAKPISATFLCKVTATIGTVNPQCPAPENNSLDSLPYWHITHLGTVRSPQTGKVEPRGIWCGYEYVVADSIGTALSLPIPTADSLIGVITGFSKNKPDTMLCRQDVAEVIPLSPASVWLHTSLAEQVGVTSKCPATGPVANGTSPILVALPDSLPPNSPGSGGTKKIAGGANVTVDHGASLAALIREFGGTILGQGSAEVCAAELLTTLALDKKIVSRNGKKIPVVVSDGGSVGSQLSLAWAIQEALSIWQESHQTKKLIINLSVGWEPGSDNDIHVVRDRILDAVDQGALVIAAAGNRPTKMSGKYAGLMYPAAYATESYACVPAPPGSPAGMNCPIVVPVGGVDRKDVFLWGARPQGSPHLMAPALAGAGEAAYLQTSSPSMTHLASLTGTSVSAAVLSATAARVWGKDPKLPPHAVMERIWNSARNPAGGVTWSPIGSNSIVPSVCHNAPYTPCNNETPPRIVSMCHADGSKPANEPCYPESDTTGLPTMNVAGSHKFVSKTQITTVPSECGPGYQYYHGGVVEVVGGTPGTATMTTKQPSAAAEFCPELLTPGPALVGTVNPQPGGCGCDDCLLAHEGSNEYTLYYYIRGDCPEELVNPRLVLSHTVTQATESIALGLGELIQGQPRSIADIPIPNYIDYNQVVLVATDTSTGNPVSFVWQIVH